MTPSSFVKLGSEVKDIISGIQGTAVSISRELNGNLRVAVQPHCSDNKLIDSVCVDERTLEVVGSGMSAKAAELLDSLVEPGHSVRDLASGARGMVIMVTWHLSGCVYLTVVAEIPEKGVPRSFVIPLERVELLNSEPNKTITSKPPTGGPTTRSPQLR